MRVRHELVAAEAVLGFEIKRYLLGHFEDNLHTGVFSHSLGPRVRNDNRRNCGQKCRFVDGFKGKRLDIRGATCALRALI